MEDEAVKLHRRPAVDAEWLTTKVSAYKLRVWNQCPALFKFLYVDGLWSGASPSMAFGTAFDRTVGAGYRAKRDRGDNPNPADSEEQFAAFFEEEAESVEDWMEEKPGRMKDEGTRFARHWAERTAPGVRPFAVQRRFSIAVQDWEVSGVIDLTMELEQPKVEAWTGRLIVDHKTAAKSWNAKDAAQQLQSVFYSLAAESGQLGADVDTGRVGYEVMVRLKKGPKRQRFMVGVGPEQKAHLIQRIDTTRRLWGAAFRAGAFPPNREHFMCSRRHCARWRECEREHGGRVRD